jgi:tripartite ATP-independent transporter DctM subunit
VGSIVPIVLLVVGAVFMLLAYTTTSTVAVGAYSLGLLLCLILAGLHVGAAMALSGVYAIWVIYGFGGLVSALKNPPYDSASGWSISVLPMFIFMGFLLWRSSITNKLYSGAGVWLNWLPGGLAVTTKVAGAAMGASSGSSVGIAYALGRIALPEMLRAGYPKRIALTSVLMAGSGGQLIPPSIIMVVYAGVAGTSVGQQLLSGLLPGLVLVAAYIIYLIVTSLIMRSKFDIKETPKATWADRRASLGDLWQVPLVIVLVVGGLYSGFFTATEAGAFGAFVSLIMLLVYRRKESGAALWDAIRESLASTGSIFLLLAGSTVLARALSLTGVTQAATDALANSNMTRIQFLLALIVFYIILGLFLDPIAMILLTVPLLLPVMPAFGIEPLWFGAFVVLLGELAVITPPVGVLLYVIYRVAQDREVNLGQKIAITDVMRASITFIPITIVVALVLIFFPEVVTILPELSFAE